MSWRPSSRPSRRACVTRFASTARTSRARRERCDDRDPRLRHGQPPQRCAGDRARRGQAGGDRGCGVGARGRRPGGPRGRALRRVRWEPSRSRAGPRGDRVRLGGRPVFAVCVGMQVLFEGSEEDAEAGLGLFEGDSRRLPDEVKVPHMGWNSVRWTGGTRMFARSRRAPASSSSTRTRPTWPSGPRWA